MREILYPPAQARSIGEVLETGVRIHRATAAGTMGYAVLASLAMELPYIDYLANGRPLPALALEDDTVRITGTDPEWWAWYVVGSILALFLWSALLLRQRALASGQSARPGRELRSAAVTLSTLIISSALAFAVVVAGLMLFVVPGVYLSAVLVPAPLAVVLMKKGPLESLLYAATLVRGNWWRTSVLSGAACAVFIVLTACVAALAAVVQVMVHITDTETLDTIGVVEGILVSAISMPPATALLLALLGDLLVRQGEAAGARGS
ncbi:MAG TPA: hypothetical protein VMB48_04435 [Steroidobacteraceae bacterium]|nr:hypothetical protein [Steroidobacteraceae bacterium]